MLFLASMGETGLSHDFFFKFSVGPFEVVEVEWKKMLNFEAATSKFCNCSWKFGSSPQKGKVDLCMTNGFKVLIWLTLLYFIFYCTLVRKYSTWITWLSNQKYVLSFMKYWIEVARVIGFPFWKQHSISFFCMHFCGERNFYCKKA